LRRIIGYPLVGRGSKTFLAALFNISLAALFNISAGRMTFRRDTGKQVSKSFGQTTWSWAPMQIHSFFVRMLRTGSPARQALPVACAAPAMAVAE
jgi:hypothetical protein